ncbi:MULTISPECIES: LysR family transcriptional regulator [unclassified Halomonas]|uniref:LysR family transcriptional regulator n=1 Tax=unclassified Halomonas TaxID=2609666 RepID=UPI002885E786|nr:MULTISPECIES: LysR family transcriptional regulator [unclassified Halomonas]MDT0499762.1 LysR family transcriptional regulator [Halomonas sp. PAR7]MDT0510421.1 LysR family transcriptional regulator [Halomonas sp. LES1]MDT0589870.1 LysR family transcriptional regulator [Halomonas sp. PAR8]
MTAKQLRAFLAVAQTLSFTQACEHLHLSQPALSLAIKGLEESLGGRLLTRTTRSVRLTPEGESLVPLAKRLLAEWDNTEELMRQRFTLQMGRLGVAAMPSFASNLLPPALMAFRQRYPRINITVHDVINEQVIDMVRNGQVELGIAFEPEATGSLAFTPLFNDRFVAVVPPRSLLARHARLHWEMLLTHDFIALQRPSMVRRLLEQQLEAEGLALATAFESHQLATVGRMVASGLGVSAVPSLCRAQMEELGACCLPLEAPAIERAVGILTHGELSTAALALKEVVVETQHAAEQPPATP